MLLGAFGDPGHAFPMIALGCALAARGHDVTVQTWERWRAPIEAEGSTFAAAPEYHRVPSGGPEPLDFYEAVVHATRDTLPLVASSSPTSSSPTSSRSRPRSRRSSRRPLRDADPPRLPAERARPADLLARRPPAAHFGRSRLLAPGRAARRARPAARALELNDTRARLGLPALDYTHGGTSRQLALVATFPQLEYPRAWPPHAHVVGPLMWEPPAAESSSSGR